MSDYVVVSVNRLNKGAQLSAETEAGRARKTEENSLRTRVR
jgi:hypothetical protein